MLEVENSDCCQQVGKKMEEIIKSLRIAAAQSPVELSYVVERALCGGESPFRGECIWCTRRGRDKTPGGPERLSVQLCPLDVFVTLVLMRHNVLGFQALNVQRDRGKLPQLSYIHPSS